MKSRIWQSATLAAAVLIGAAGATSQTQRQGEADQVPSTSSAKLLEVPVTKIIPGDVEVEPRITNPVAEDVNAASRGMKWFDSFNCAGCHAANGGGGMGPSLSNQSFIYGGAPENIYLSIVQGRPNGMPAWGTILPENVIWELVAYIRSISNAPSPQWGTTTSLESFKIEQVPAEFISTPNPWQYTQPFSFGQKPSGEEEKGG